MEWVLWGNRAPGTPEGQRTLRVSGMAMGSHQAFEGGGCSPFLPFPCFREEPPGFEAKEDYPMSKEELLSQVKKAVRT